MKPNEEGETLSVLPPERDLDWGGNLPSIPSATGVFWPSIAAGALCTLLGFYLVFTPAPTNNKAVDRGASPEPFASRIPDSLVTSEALKVLRCGFVDSKDSTFALGMEEFAKEVKKRTGGELVIELLPDGLVDGKRLAERELVEQVLEGRLAMALSTTSPLSNFNHDLDVFDLPLLFTSFEHADIVLEGPVGEELLNSLQSHHLIGLAYFEVGFRIFSSSIPLPNYESFKGKKLRVMQSVTLSRFVKAIGGDPVPAPVDKIYMMGKEGYIDGAGRTYPTYWDFHLYDVHRFISETRHAYSVKMVLINEELLKSLSPKFQSALKIAAMEAARFQRKKQREADQRVKKLALKEGIKIFELTDVDRKKFVDASVELYDEYRKNQSESILDRVEAVAKNLAPKS